MIPWPAFRHRRAGYFYARWVDAGKQASKVEFVAALAASVLGVSQPKSVRWRVGCGWYNQTLACRLPACMRHCVCWFCATGISAALRRALADV